MEERILLVDFMYLWNRIYFAIGQNGDGDYYKHMQGIVEKINNNPNYAKKYIILDGINGTQRQKELLPEYKEGRIGKEEVYSKINQFIKERTSTCVNVTFLRANNHEADEVISTFAKLYSKKGKQVYIYSGDKDLLQLLVFPNVHVGMKYTGLFELKPFTSEEIQKKMDTISNGTIDKVGDIVKFRVFRGDASDKIPAAIPRFPSKVIKELIDNVWTGVKPLNRDIIGDMEEYLPEKYSNQITNYKEDIIRNWELMNLQFLPDKAILNDTMKLS